MRRRPKGPVQLDLGAGGHVGGKVGWAGTVDAVGGVTTALDIVVGEDGHGAVALDGTRNSLGRGALVRISVRLVELVRGTTDGTVGHVTVTSDQGRRDNETSEVLHFVSCSCSSFCGSICSLLERQRGFERMTEEREKEWSDRDVAK